MAMHQVHNEAGRVPLTAVILAGGESRRMGRDKALVEFEGQAMWQRQLELLQALEPVEILVSGPARAEFPADLRTVKDAGPGRGPLAGLAAVLRVAQAEHVLILAIDLPLMTAEFLESLRGRLQRGRGVVPCRMDAETGKKFYEPLAAIYPRDCASIVERHLAGTDWSMQGFVREAMAADLLAAVEIPAQARRIFRNVNLPDEAGI